MTATAMMFPHNGFSEEIPPHSGPRALLKPRPIFGRRNPRRPRRRENGQANGANATRTCTRVVAGGSLGTCSRPLDRTATHGAMENKPGSPSLSEHRDGGLSTRRIRPRPPPSPRPTAPPPSSGGAVGRGLGGPRRAVGPPGRPLP